MCVYVCVKSMLTPLSLLNLLESQLSSLCQEEAGFEIIVSDALNRIEMSLSPEWDCFSTKAYASLREQGWEIIKTATQWGRKIQQGTRVSVILKINMLCIHVLSPTPSWSWLH